MSHILFNDEKPWLANQAFKETPKSMGASGLVLRGAQCAI